MKGQKRSVVEAVQMMLPNFNLYKDIALVMLTKDQLESLKLEIGQRIFNGTIEYGKDRANKAEVFAYARSMTMNHLKKARELNGNQIYGVGPVTSQPKQSKTIATINMDLLSDELKAFVKSIV